MDTETSHQGSETVDAAACRRFEAAWRTGKPESIENVLPPPDRPNYLATLEELVHIELELGWRRVAKANSESGEGTVVRPPRVEEYLARFPALNDGPILLRLAKQELKVRGSGGERPALDEYRARFPQLPLTAQDFEEVHKASSNKSSEPPVIARYDILEVLGRGGMGVVYRARQTALGRQVALKMILAGEHAAATETARFRREAEAVASLQHPNIVQIYEIGEQAGRPYFSLEFVDGGTLDSHIKNTPQLPATAARISETLARAVHFAHQKGIVHRDLKPANVLLSAGGQTELQRMTPKIADFGLAKRLESQGDTRTGDILGTPSYMAPEQASGNVRDIGPCTDVYALGGILYTMLTGRPPFRGATSFDTLNQVLTVDTVPPSRLVPTLPRDLETICLKCLEKEPQKRYATAELLAEDLDRFLQDRPILARPVGSAERAWRLCRRKPLVASLIAGVILSVVGGTVTSILLAIRAGIKADEAETNAQAAIAQQKRTLTEKDRADAEAQTATNNARIAWNRKLQSDWRLYISNMRLAQLDWHNAGIDRFVTLIEAHRHPEKDAPDPRGFEWYFLERLTRAELFTFKKHTGIISAVTFSPDGRRIASAGMEVMIWEALTGKELRLRDTLGVSSLAFSPDGKHLAGGSNKGIKLWNPQTGALIATIQAGNVRSVSFSADGKFLASSSDPQDGTPEKGKVTVWDVNTGLEVRSFTGLSGPAHLAYSRDGKRLACTSAHASATIWNPEDGKELLKVPGPPYAVGALALSADGKRLATAYWTSLKIRNADTGEDLATLHGHTSNISALKFSADGKFLASASFDRTIRVWNVEAGSEVYSFRGHSSEVHSVAFSPDGRLLAAGSLDGGVKVWRAAPLEYRGFNKLAQSAAFSGDGKYLAAVGRVWDEKLQRNIAGQVTVLDIEAGRELFGARAHAREINAVSFSPAGKVFATAGSDHDVLLWELGKEKPTKTLKGHSDAVMGVAFSPDGRRLASASTDRTVRLWDADSGEIVISMAAGYARDVAFSGDGKHLAAAGDDVRIWDAATGKLLHTLKGHTNSASCVSFSHDGKLLASGSWDKTVRVWNVANGKEEFLLKGHTNFVNSVSFGARGRLASGSLDQTIKIWETTTGEEILSLKGHAGGISCVAFSRDGRQLASAGYDHSVKIWDAK